MLPDGFVARETYFMYVAGDDAKMVTVLIGAPYQADTSWNCHCEIQGMKRRLPEGVGESSMQALAMAVSLALTVLVNEVRTGAALYPSAACNGAPFSEAELLADWQDICDMRDAAQPEYADDDVTDLASAKAQIARLRRALTAMEIERDALRGPERQPES